MTRLSPTPSRRSTHERVESSTEPLIVEPPRSASVISAVRTSQAGGECDRGTLGIGELIDERIEITTALILKLRF